MQLGPLTFPECFDFEFPLLARLKKEYSHTPLWFEEFLDPSNEMESTVLEVVRLLNQMYCILDNYSQAAMNDAATRLAILYAALFDMSEPPLWRMKPKIHLMLHLVKSLHSPTKTWTYRDEDYGGSAARSMRSRGGHDTAKVAGKTLLLKFCARHELPRGG